MTPEQRYLQELWQKHVACEFATHDCEETLECDGAWGVHFSTSWSR